MRPPPRLGVPEETIAPAYARAAWRAKLMFDRAHVLHRQIYDIYADERLTRRVAPAAGSGADAAEGGVAG